LHESLTTCVPLKVPHSFYGWFQQGWVGVSVTVWELYTSFILFLLACKIWVTSIVANKLEICWIRARILMSLDLAECHKGFLSPTSVDCNIGLISVFPVSVLGFMYLVSVTPLDQTCSILHPGNGCTQHVETSLQSIRCVRITVSVKA